MNDERVLRIERIVPAPPDVVFAAWTEPEKIQSWWGPRGMRIPKKEIDLREGGSWLTVMQAPDGNEVTVSGTYRTIDPPSRLVFTWAWHNDGVRSDDETEVDVVFAPTEGGTKLTLVQQRFATVDARDNHNKGWVSSLDCLDDFVGA